MLYRASSALLLALLAVACAASGPEPGPAPEPGPPPATAPGEDAAAPARPDRTPPAEDQTCSSALAVHTATVPGGDNGAPPCATDAMGTSGTDLEHPQGAPLQTSAAFANGTRWAICGASVGLGSELFNLRSDDNGVDVVDDRTQPPPRHQ